MLGFDDSEHTRGNGERIGEAFQLNAAGQAIGISRRYNGGDAALGQSAWFFDGTTTIRVGRTGPEFTRNDGFRSSAAQHLNQLGQVAGYSRRYSAVGTDLGTVAWVYSGGTTSDIGLTGVEYTRNDGYKASSPWHMNEVGNVLGISMRYNGGPVSLGQAAWLFNGSNTYEIGLTGSDFTSVDGSKYNFVSQLNDAGRAIGRAYRFNGGSPILGTSAWYFDGTTTLDISLKGVEHTRNDGYRDSVPLHMNEVGLTTGTSRRYNGGGEELGRTAWLYNGTTTVNLGLAGVGYTRNDGFKSSYAWQMNDAGWIAGDSWRFEGGIHLGQNAWIYNGVSTVSIGLTAAEHTRYDGRQFSTPSQMNDVGEVAGYSNRYSPLGSDLGRSAWLYDGQQSIRVGLTGATFSRNDGYMFSETRGLNQSGQVVGYSYRYNAGLEAGQVAWLYDPQLVQTFPLVLSARSDGYAYSEVQYLGDDGLVLGFYSAFDSQDKYLGQRAFYFSVSDGAHDLGSLVEGGLYANGWALLGGATSANGLGQILEHGRLSSQTSGSVPCLLNPVLLAGDYNQNGFVDAVDYTVWRDTLGQTGVGLAADGSGPNGLPDGVVDQIDYAIWKANFGRTSQNGRAGQWQAGTDVAMVVPEPMSCRLLGWLAVVLIARSGRSRH